MDGYSSKIRKVSGCRPTVSNETILATEQEFFFTKEAPVQIITDIALLGFWFILLPYMFISSYTTICFFVNKIFSSVYISVNTIFQRSYLFLDWEISHALSACATGRMEGENHPKCVQEGEEYHASCVRKHLHYLFSCCFLMVSRFICRNLTLRSFKKGVFVRNCYFSPVRSTCVVIK